MGISLSHHVIWEQNVYLSSVNSMNISILTHRNMLFLMTNTEYDYFCSFMHNYWL